MRVDSRDPVGDPDALQTRDRFGRRGISSARTPWTESGFWVLQLVVLALALVRLAVTVGFGLDPHGLVLDVSTVALFVVPVTLAALNYGLPGGLATVGWTVVLCIPRMAQASGRGDSSALWAEVVQVAALGAVAALVGRRVTAESASRHQAEISRSARLEAELLYQEMFESNLSPILIVDADGFVVGSNSSADRAFHPPPARRPDPTAGTAVGATEPRRLVDVIGPDAASLVLTRLIAVGDPTTSPEGGPAPVGGRSDGGSRDAEDRVPPVPVEIGGRMTLLRPTVTRVGRHGQDLRMQVIFEDVTAETRRHDLMAAFAGQVVLGQEEERRHLAQELHDGPLQSLIHLCRQIDSLAPGPARQGSDGTAFASMRATVEATVAELRSIARGLRPSVLDDLGLVVSINQVLVEATARQGFASRFDVTGSERRLQPAMELALFRIAQEAITNIEHHAMAERVTLTLEFGDAGLRLRVEDDGAGFDPTHQRHHDGGKSLGLPGMNERARLIGARLRVDSAPGQGTMVETWLPWGKDDR